MIQRVSLNEDHQEKPLEVVQRLALLLTERGLQFATAESCTGGIIASRVTSLSGSSTFYRGGVVAYSNEVKEQLLNVSSGTLQEYGAVSEATVVEMALGAKKCLGADCAVATSGIAGPGGGTPEKPVGTIWIAAVLHDQILTYIQTGDEGRRKNADRAASNALRLLLKLLESEV